jgi:hypothetical protein
LDFVPPLSILGDEKSGIVVACGTFTTIKSPVNFNAHPELIQVLQSVRNIGFFLNVVGSLSSAASSSKLNSFTFLSGTSVDSECTHMIGNDVLLCTPSLLLFLSFSLCLLLSALLSAFLGSSDTRYDIIKWIVNDFNALDLGWTA